MIWVAEGRARESLAREQSHMLRNWDCFTVCIELVEGVCAGSIEVPISTVEQPFEDAFSPVGPSDHLTRTARDIVTL